MDSDQDSGIFAFDHMSSAVLQQLMEAMPLVVLTTSSFRELVDEFADDRAAMTFFIKEATMLDKPIALNIADSEGSITTFVSPPGWSEDRLAGWVATAKPELGRQFGDIGPIISPSSLNFGNGSEGSTHECD